MKELSFNILMNLYSEHARNYSKARQAKEKATSLLQQLSHFNTMMEERLVLNVLYDEVQRRADLIPDGFILNQITNAR